MAWCRRGNAREADASFDERDVPRDGKLATRGRGRMPTPQISRQNNIQTRPPGRSKRPLGSGVTAGHSRESGLPIQSVQYLAKRELEVLMAYR